MTGRPISPRRLKWLAGELEGWREEGVLDERAAQRITAGYVASTRAQAVRLFLYVGAGLFGVGIIWLVAANLDIHQVGPLARFIGVAGVWLAMVVATEACVAYNGGRLAALAGPLGLLALLAYGGTIFQAAQSLQVPAYEPSLLVAWSLGGLAYVYAIRAAAALVLAVGTLGGWYVWALLDGGGEGPAVVLALSLAVVVAGAIATLHDGGPLARLAGPWRAVASMLALAALFAAAVPGVVTGRIGPAVPIALGILAGLLLSALAVARRSGSLPEIAGALAVPVLAGLLILLAPRHYDGVFSSARPGTAQILYTLFACAAFLSAALGVALVGVRHETRTLTDLALGFLLVFIAVQSFGVLATILSGAGLMLGTGAILFAAGVALDRARRRLIETIAR